MNIIEKAILLAGEKHKNQSWFKDYPYTVHLALVAETASKYSSLLPKSTSIEQMIAAAWLHDIIEDCQLSRDFLSNEFGDQLSTLIWRVSDEPGPSRKERKIATYPKIAMDDSAIFLKVCDRIVNVRASSEEKGKHYKMYEKERSDFEASLRNGKFEEMWFDLSKLFEG